MKIWENRNNLITRPSSIFDPIAILDEETGLELRRNTFAHTSVTVDRAIKRVESEPAVSPDINMAAGIPSLSQVSIVFSVLL